MIPVGMGENEVVSVTVFIDQLAAKSSYAGSGIDNDNVVTFCSDFYTGGIPTIFDIFFP
jgi:hypothetical protein